MQKLNVPFTGIVRNVDEGLATDGQSMELINARIKNGAVEPISVPVFKHSLPQRGARYYWHELAKRYIAIGGDTPCSVTDDGVTDQYLSPDVSAATNVEFMGNVAVFLSDDAIRYALWDGTSYKYLGCSPELPEMEFEVENSAEVAFPEGKLVFRPQSGWTSENYAQSAEYNAVGYYDNAIDSLNKNGYVFGSVLIRYAFRTSNGDYINLSMPMLCECATEIKHHFVFPGDTLVDAESVNLSLVYPLSCVIKHDGNLSQGREYYHAFAAMGTKVTCTPKTFNLSDWSGFIVSLDVFACPVHYYKKEEMKIHSISYTAYPYNPSKSVAEKGIKEASRFYKVLEFDLKGNKTWELENWSDDNLAVQEYLTEGSYNPHQLTGNSSYVYNSRLHVANNIQTLTKGFSHGWEARYDEQAGAGTACTLEVYTYLNTEQGQSVVKNTIASNSSELSLFLSYPDSRAYKMFIRAIDSSGNCRGKEFALTKHYYLNLAYYLAPITYKADGTRNEYLHAHGIDTTTWPFNNPSISERNTRIFRPTVLQVSALNNPLVFPVAQTYQPGREGIVGLCSNTVALSQGQFGQHPLYVFTKGGVYAMAVDTSGSTVYSTQVPITRDVCTSPSSIAGVDNGVCFASRRGLMLIAGGEARLISEALDGFLPSCVDSSPVIRKVAAVAELEDALSSTGFNGYIEGASVAYNYQENELYVSNPAYAYAYIYNIGTGTWSKMSPNVTSFVRRYPECYAVIEPTDTTQPPRLYDLQNDYRSVAKMLLLTRPIHMGTTTHKRILQAALRGIVKRALSDLYLRGEELMYRGDNLDIFTDVGLYILGSNDAEHFTLVSGKEKIADVRDLVTKMNKSKAYKWFMVCLAGGVRSDVSLNYTEFLVDETFTNRLR